MSTTTFNSIGDRVNITGLLAAPDSSWHSLDLSAYIPAGATAAIVEIQNTGSSTAGVWGVRHPGSGIETGNFSYSTSRLFLLAPLDASRVTAYKRTSSAAIFYLHGWTMGGVTMLTNRVSIPAFPGPNYSWQPLAMSAYAPGATALIIEAYSTYPSAAEISFRAQGSSDPAHGAHLRYHGFWIVKANNGACEYEASAGYNQAYLVGYVTETENGGFSMRTNCLDISPANAGDSGVERQKSLDFQIPVGSEMTLHLVGSAGSNSRIRRDASMPADYNYTSANESIPVPSQPAQPFSVLVTFQDYRFATGRFLVQGWVAQVPWYLLHTSAATNIQAASFDGNANFTYGGNLGEIDQYGFEYGTSSGVYPNNVLESGPPPGSPYSLTIPNLSPSTWYFFRAKMHHPTYGWIYGEEFSLQTAFDPSLILFEKQNTSEISASNLFGANWKAQTFTPISGHLVQAVKLKLRLAGAPNGILEVSIKATSGGVPTGPDLAYGNMPCSMLSSMATVYSINLTLGAVLNGGTRYAVVVRATSQNVSNQVYWTQGLNVYANGQYIQSTDSGSTWPYISDVDLYFEEWGNAPVETYPATDIGAVQAVGNGFMTDPTNIDQIGFEWGTTPGGPYPDSVTDTSAPFFAGIFSLLMTGLSPATPYYYRAKIHHTTLGWIYGAEKTFTTTVGIPLTRTDP
nr:hypothetical protein [Dehalococcoidia bacterium]